MNKPVVLIAAVSVLLAAAPTRADHAWDKKINNPNRFNVLAAFGGSAVLDRETQLVWERSPEATQFSWPQAQAHCNTKNVGNRKGWRLPTVQELASLVDPTVAAPGPTLPAGHPFMNIKTTTDPNAPPGLSSSAYWSANTWSADPTVAWDVSFNTGVTANTGKNGFHWVWCVRGGQGVDVQEGSGLLHGAAQKTAAAV